MNEQELRSLVREAIERHLGRPEKIATYEDRVAPEPPRPMPFAARTTHASHILLKVVPGSQVDDGMCVIEPAVRCNHCGFCQSYGH
jgi:hypothetical protein